jgi:methionyl-tRNA formyltransferase
LAGNSRSVLIGGVDISAACLEALHSVGFPPELVIGYPEEMNAASGYVDVASFAERQGIPALRSTKLNHPEIAAQIAAVAPAIIWVVGWSRLIDPSLLTLPEHGCVGIHPTSLPEGRGRAPIPWTILKGLQHTASTMFFLTEGIDEGDIIGKSAFALDAREDAATLYAKHRAAHVELMKTHAGALLSGDAPRVPQDHRQATVWPRRRPEEGRIDWTQDAATVDLLVRAVTRPFPGAWSEAEGLVHIWRGEPASSLEASPGTIVRSEGSLMVACGTGSLRVLEADGLSPALTRLC